MKTIIYTLLVALMTLTAIHTNAQTPAMKEVKQTVQKFMKAGDQNDSKTMEGLLDSNYRVVMNQLFGSEEVSILPRDVYLQKISSKEFGGDSRKITFKEVIINGNNAVVNVESIGEKSTMTSIIVLIKDVDNSWKLVSDTPVFN